MFVAKLARNFAPAAKTAVSGLRNLTTEVAKSAVEDEFKARLGISHVQTGRASAGGAVASFLRAQLSQDTTATGTAPTGNSATKAWGAHLNQSVTSQSNIRADSRFPSESNLPAGNLLQRARRILL